MFVCPCFSEDNSSCKPYHRMEEILYHIPSSFITVDGRWNVTYANKRILDLLEKKEEEILHTSIWDYSTGRFNPPIEPAMRRVMERRQQEQFRTHSLKTDRWYEIRIFPLLDGIGCYFHDTTESHRAHEALVKNQDLLEKQVEQRTRQLRTLFSELTKVEQQERQKLAQILHDDLQQTLVAVKLRIDNALHEIKSLPEAAREEAETCVREAARMIRDAISTSRSLSTELAPRILYETGLPRALEWLGDQMQQKYKLHVQVRAQPDADFEDNDMRTLLFQAARELLSNVHEHARVREAQLDLVRRQGSIELHVTDQGGGISAKEMDNLFSREGHFGLISIQERIAGVGGRMEIQSRPGKGTRVSLIVPEEPPRVETAPEVIAAATREEAEEVVFVPRAGPKTIRVLLVDDHKIVREGLSRMLRRIPDIEVVGDASDGRMGVETARQLRPDVVVMDISMPVMNGLEATRIISAEMPDVKVIGLSMYTGSDMSESMLQAGAVGMMSKDAPRRESHHRHPRLQIRRRPRRPITHKTRDSHPISTNRRQKQVTVPV